MFFRGSFVYESKQSRPKNIKYDVNMYRRLHPTEYDAHMYITDDNIDAYMSDPLEPFRAVVTTHHNDEPKPPKKTKKTQLNKKKRKNDHRASNVYIT